MPLNTAADLPGIDDNPGVILTAAALYNALSTAGHQLTWTAYITARNPSPDEAATLDIPSGTPALITRRITRNTTGQPLAMEEAHRSAEDTQLAYIVSAGSSE